MNKPDKKPDYVGTIATVRKHQPLCNTLTGQAGDYIILRQTADALYGCSTAGGSDSAELVKIPITGSHYFEVSRYRQDDALLERVANTLERVANSLWQGLYTPSTYTNAAATAKMIRAILDKKKNDGDEDTDGVVFLVLKPGQKCLVRMLSSAA